MVPKTTQTEDKRHEIDRYKLFPYLHRILFVFEIQREPETSFTVSSLTVFLHTLHFSFFVPSETLLLSLSRTQSGDTLCSALEFILSVFIDTFLMSSINRSFTVTAHKNTTKP